MTSTLDTRTSAAYKRATERAANEAADELLSVADMVDRATSSERAHDALRLY